MSMAAPSVGELLRGWRIRRHLSQLAFAAEAEISQRHLSFVESGRAAPSREMVLRLAERLDIPLRERNALLVAAGYAPLFRERSFEAPDFAAARAAVEAILEGHLPHPALAVDRHWNLLAANATARYLMATVAPALLEPPVNVLRLSLHPDGLAGRIANYREWRSHILWRLAALSENSGDPALAALAAEFEGYPVPLGARPYRPSPAGDRDAIAVSLQLETEAGRLDFLSTTTVFGTALDITLAELTIETFFPADAETAAKMRALAEGSA